VSPDEEVQALARKASQLIKDADLEGLSRAIREAETELLVEGLRQELDRVGPSGFSSKGRDPR
jgi:hypothetical protein